MIRILIVTDIRLYRDGLADFLAKRERLAVVGTADSRATAVGQARDLAPDVILVDQAMPAGGATIRDLLALMPSPKVLALGVAETEGDVIACAEAGASGYVAREASLDELVAAVESVGRGELLCSPRAAASLMRRVALRAAGNVEPIPANRLTIREVQIVRLIEQGLSNKEIASRLGIEVATVKNHVHNVLEKLQVHRRAEAATRLRDHPLRATRGEGVPA
jgi:two-component system nitrate/nitrite response regulator NarL